MNAPTILEWIGGIGGTSGLIVAVQGIAKDWFHPDEREGKRAEAAAKRSEGAATAAEAAVSKHASWRSDFEKNYDIIEKRCEDCELRLAAQDRKIEAYDRSWRYLLDEMNEQVIPMIAETEIRVFTRSIITKAQQMRIPRENDAGEAG